MEKYFLYFLKKILWINKLKHIIEYYQDYFYILLNTNIIQNCIISEIKKKQMHNLNFENSQFNINYKWLLNYILI